MFNPASGSCTCTDEMKETAFECFAGDRGCGTGAMIPMDELGPGKTESACRPKKNNNKKKSIGACWKKKILTIHNRFPFHPRRVCVCVFSSVWNGNDHEPSHHFTNQIKMIIIIIII